VRVHTEVLSQDPPATCAAEVQQAMERAAQRVPDLRIKRLVSHAYHDALFMAQRVPMGMLFIPCYKGYSHRPDEFAAPELMAAGARLLALTLAELAGSAGSADASTIREEL
jgi:ureidoglycolate amidohydrolase